MNEIKGKMDAITKDLKEKLSEMELQLTLKTEEINKLRTDLEKTNKVARSAQLEGVKLKQRIQKLKNKRFRIEDNQKICKKCGKEYLEKEN